MQQLEWPFSWSRHISLELDVGRRIKAIIQCQHKRMDSRLHMDQPIQWTSKLRSSRIARIQPLLLPTVRWPTLRIRIPRSPTLHIQIAHIPLSYIPTVRTQHTQTVQVSAPCSVTQAITTLRIPTEHTHQPNPPQVYLNYLLS